MPLNPFQLKLKEILKHFLIQWPVPTRSSLAGSTRSLTDKPSRSDERRRRSHSPRWSKLEARADWLSKGVEPWAKACQTTKVCASGESSSVLIVDTPSKDESEASKHLPDPHRFG